MLNDPDIIATNSFRRTIIPTVPNNMSKLKPIVFSMLPLIPSVIMFPILKYYPKRKPNPSVKATNKTNSTTRKVFISSIT